MSGQSSSREQQAVSAAVGDKKEYVNGDDEMIVNYNDAVLYGRDLKLLEGSEGTSFSTSMSLWLNDGLVHFRLVLLAHMWRHRADPFQESTGAPTAPPRESAPFLCMDPSVLSLLMMLNPGGGTNDDIEDFDEELQSIAASHNNFEGVHVFFLPVNDGLDASCRSARQAPPNTAQGTHWSLLVAISVGDAAAGDGDAAANHNALQHKTQNRHLAYLHFDSVPGHNQAVALALAARWNLLWCVAASRADQGSSVASSLHGGRRSRAEASEIPVRECRSPRQANGYDCGVHVLGSVEALLKDVTTMLENHSHVHFTYDQLFNLINSWEEALRRYFGTDPARACASLRQRMARDIRLLGRATR